MPSISELLIILVLTVAIGIATRYFGSPKSALKRRDGDASAAKAESAGKDRGKKLERDPDTGVYVPESDEGKSD